MPKTGAKKSVRNLYAFDVLQSIFLSASTKDLCLTLLDTIKTIYLQDLSNYFILEPQNTLVLFTKKIYQKPVEVQESFFSMLEVLVRHLNYVPMKEISSIVVLLKTCNFNVCMSLTLRHLIRLLEEYKVFREVYQDVGLLELSVELLVRFASLSGELSEVKSDQNNANYSISRTPSTLQVVSEIGQLLMDLLRQCVTANMANTDLCLRLGLSDCLINQLLSARSRPNSSKWRRWALTILEELALTSGGEELMPALLIKLHSAFVELKIEILRSFCRILRESHRCRVVFRKMNGFVYVLQELVSLERCLSCSTAQHNGADGILSNGTEWYRQTTRSEFLANLSYGHIFKLVRIIFATLGIAMKFEPANAHYFATEIQYSNLTNAVVSLGSFDGMLTEEPSSSSAETTVRSTKFRRHDSRGSAGGGGEGVDVVASGQDLFNTLFRNLSETERVLLSTVRPNSVSQLLTIHLLLDSTVNPTDSALSTSTFTVPRCLIESCVLARYLYDLAVDAYDRYGLWRLRSIPPLFSQQYDLYVTKLRPAVCNTRLLHSSGSQEKRSIDPANDLLPASAEKRLDNSGYSQLAQTNSPVIVHPGAIISLLRLVAQLDQRSKGTPELLLDLQTCLLDVIGELLRLERNQQIMCVNSMPKELLTLFRDQLATESAHLHDRVHALFECLAIQSLTPSDLREFLRISNPLSCCSTELVQPSDQPCADPLAEVVCAVKNARSRYGGPLPLSQIKCIIATASPISTQMARPNWVDSQLAVYRPLVLGGEQTNAIMGCAVVPPFVEFDMGPEGFGCLFLPSIAPQGPSSVANLSGAAEPLTSDSAAGGVGIGERPFPPPHGLTFSTWVSVVQFDKLHTISTNSIVSTSTTSPEPNSRSRLSCAPQPQAVHLLTIVRGIQSVNDQLICLRVYIHPETRMLVVSTQERVAQQDQVCDLDTVCGPISDVDADGRPPTHGSEPSSDMVTTSSCAMFPCGLPNSADPHSWPLGVWRHLTVVFSRAGMIKSSSCSVYLDGKLVGARRLSYLGSSAATSGFLGRQTMPSSVCAFIGTPATDRRPSSLVWRQGPCHLIEEPLHANRVAYLTRLGPNYMGSFQSAPPIFGKLRMCLETRDANELVNFITFSSQAILSEVINPWHHKCSLGVLKILIPVLLFFAHVAFYLRIPPVIADFFSFAYPLKHPSLLSFFSLITAYPSTASEEHCYPLFGEEKLVFGIYASALTTMTLSRIRKVYSYADAKAIAKQFYIAPKENATPIRVLHNSAAHLHGPSRPLGAVLVGYQGVRAFTPSPMTCQLHCVGGGPGGVRVGLALIAMAVDVETLYAATKAACALIQCSLAAADEMRATRGYEVQSPIDHPAFEDLLCDLDLWRIERHRPELIEQATNEHVRHQHESSLLTKATVIVIENDYRLVTNLLNHLVELLSVPSNQRRQSSLLPTGTPGGSRLSGLSTQLLHPIWTLVFDRIIFLLMNAHSPTQTWAVLPAPSTRFTPPNRPVDSITVVSGRSSLLDAAMLFIRTYFSNSVSRRGLLQIGQLMAWTLPGADVDETEMPFEKQSMVNEPSTAELIERQERLINLRNSSFEMLLKLISDSPNINKKLCNEIVTVLGFDWLYLFLRPCVHSSTVVLALHLLLLIILNPGYYVSSANPLYDWSNRFRSVPASKPHPSAKSNQDVTGGVGSQDVATPFGLDTDGLSAFRIGLPAGRWLWGCELLLKRRLGLMLDSTSRHSRHASRRATAAVREFHLDSCQQPGFAVLKALLPHHSHVPQLYYLLTALLLQIPVRHIPVDFQLEFDSLYTFVLQKQELTAFNSDDTPNTDISTAGSDTVTSTTIPSASQMPSSVSGLVSSFLSGAGLTVGSFGRRRVRTRSDSDSTGVITSSDSSSINVQPRSTICSEAATILLCCVRELLFKANCSTFHPCVDIPKKKEWDWTENYSEVTLRFLLFLYRSKPSFRPVVMCSDFIGALIGILNCGSRPSDILELNRTRDVAHQPAEPNFKHSSVLRLALEFVKTIVTDSLMLHPSAHQPVHVIDMLLEALSDQCGSKKQDELQTNVLCELLEHIIATDLLVDQTVCVPPGGDRQYISVHLVYFCSRIVDKLWQGCFTGEVTKLVSFLIQLIEIWPDRSSSPITEYHLRFNLNSVYRSLNRAVLYQLSRPILTRYDQQQALELFAKVQPKPSPTEQCSVIHSHTRSLDMSVDLEPTSYESDSLLFHPENADPDLPACLIHLLMQFVRSDRLPAQGPHVRQPCNIAGGPLTYRPKLPHTLIPKTEAVEQLTNEESGANVNYYRTTFCEDDFETGDGSVVLRSPEAKCLEQTQSGLTEPVTSSPSESSELSSENFNRITEAALQLWAECYLARKTVIAALVPDAPLVSGLTVPSLTDWAPVLEAPCLMAWAQHVDSEAAGTGGTSSDALWGRIPGAPSTESQTAPNGLVTTPSLIPKGSPGSTSQTSTGMHHQLSLRLSRLPSSMFRLAAMSSVPNNQSSLVDGPLSPSSSSAVVSTAHVATEGVAKHIATVGLTQSNIIDNVRKTIDQCMPQQLTHLRELMEQQRKRHHRNMTFVQCRLEVEWDQVERELTRERGLWGPTNPDRLTRWKLDPTEGPCRMRKRMMPNPSFFTHYPYQPLIASKTGVSNPAVPHGTFSSDILPLRCRQPRSRDGRLHFLNYQSRRILHEDWGPLAPWLSFVDRPSASNDDQALSDAALPSPVDSPGTDMLDASSEAFEPYTTSTELKRPFDADDLEQSLRQTASLLRSREQPHTPVGNSSPTDDVDELMEPNELNSDREEALTETLTAPEQGDDDTLNDLPFIKSTEPVQVNPATIRSSPPINVPSCSPTVIAEEEQLASHEAILRLLEPGERPTVMYRCARILGLDVFEGLLLFGKSHFYVIDGYTLINTREIVDIDSLSPDIVHEPIVPCISGAGHAVNSPVGTTANLTDLSSTGAVSQTSGKQYFKFPYENIQDVHKRRYLLQPIALEVFNADGRNFLLVFAKGLQSKVYQRFQDVVAAHSTTQSFMHQKNTSSLLSSLLGEKTVTQRWERGELSNFQYLMYLNTLAGRSYNDLMQYSIFPWVLADYDSEELDLSRPETFRDLSRPMGAQTARRFSQFQRRFKEWDDPSGETPPYHYGTHYSSAMIVASYLVRMEPFTQHFLKLQGGHFDLPDRMFYSIKDTWLSASEYNMADVRELIPEFFYLPDFLINFNRFELGTRQNGLEVDHVILPPWAKSDPREFIRAHREALESEYVSAHLHEWIDLIFGYRQQGEAAVQAGNVFHHLFYEGNVDIYSIDDPLKRSAVIGFINNFGQIPKQLFRKPHPSRRIAVPRGPAALFPKSSGRRNSSTQLAADLFYRNLDCLRPHLQPLKELKHAVGQIVQLDPRLVPNAFGSNSVGPSSDSGGGDNADCSIGVNANGVASGGLFGDHTATLVSPSCPSPAQMGISSTIPGGPIVAVEQHKCLLPPHHIVYVAWGFTDGSLRLGSVLDSSERARWVFEMVDEDEVLCCAVPNKRTLITAGISTVVRVWKLQPFDSHTGRPSLTGAALGVINDSSSGVTSTVSTSGPSSGAISSSTSSTTAPSIGCRLRLRADLCGHTEAVTCLTASTAFNLVVSGSRDRTCILWDLTRLAFLRQLIGHSAPVAAVSISEANGDIVSCAGAFLHLWNCNGEAVASVDTQVGWNKQVLCVCMSTLYDWDAENVILTGGSDGVVRMWSLEYVRSAIPTGEAGSRLTSDPQITTNPSGCEAVTTGKVAETEIYSKHDTQNSSASSRINLKQSTSNGKEEPSCDWTRQLVCRGKLTMHTAYGRSDNQQPAAVTALAISRDHRSVLVGDARGRVYAWSVPPDSARGGMTDQWVRDEGATNCAADGCGVRFTLTERKHHCRNCGKVFCSKCSRFESEVHRLRLFKRVRVCQTCFTLLKVIQAPKGNAVQSAKVSAVPESNVSG
ncbi:WD repeat and FYVE domain-containing protein 3 [Paragonimus westermani]|uniref:WD repeat and FYVE domain-containing protein 3 n=1 Tax=Paragonimus westermani TaxID=34504 RepID=A0A5J4NV88_9TREM|nr:WD repeat and FYVE domain-containing protein 3 [Paragonimus westermani]